MTDSEAPDELIPAFQFDEPNKPVHIADDETCIKDSNGNVLLRGSAEIRLDLLPTPRIHVHVTSPAIGPKIYTSLEQHAKVLELKKYGSKIKGYPTTINLSIPGGISLVWSPNSEPIIGVGDNNTRIHHVVFHLFNFKRIIGTNWSVEKHGTKYTRIEHVNLKANNWVVELRSLAESDDNFKKLRNEGGYGLTHVGSLKKADLTLFSGEEAADMLDMLRFFFSYAKGAWCEPICAVGFDSLGNRVWESWSSPKESWRVPDSWFDDYNSKQIEDFFLGFCNRWADEEWRDTFHEVIYWYLNANNPSRGIEAGVILTQAALERMSFDYVVKEKPAEVGDFKKKNASGKFKFLFSNLEIPVDITENTPKLMELEERLDLENALHAITKIRNSLVHSNYERRRQFKSAMFETWKLGLWYLELALLRLCGYSGTYSNRLTAKRVGQIENVPWKIQDCSEKPED